MKKVDTKEQAKGIFNDLPEQKVLFVNNRGEFFTNENLCRNSVKKDSEFSKIERSEVVTEGSKKNTNTDLTIEDLKAKGEGLEEFLNDMKRGELDALDGLFEFSIPELPNKGECVEQIVAALAE